MAVSKVILNGTTLIDVTKDTVAANNLLSGETATGADGEAVIGEYVAPSFKTQSKSATPSETSQTVTPDTGFDGLSQVEIEAMKLGELSVAPSTSEQSFTADNVVLIDYSYTRVGVNYVTIDTSSLVNGKTYAFEGRTSGSRQYDPVIPFQTTIIWNDGFTYTSSENGSITFENGRFKVSNGRAYWGFTIAEAQDGYKKVTVAAMPAGVAGVPIASKGSVSNNTIPITPYVDNTTGYITGGIKTGATVTVSASELVSGTKTVTNSGNVDVTNYATAYVSAGSVMVPGAMVSSGAKIIVSDAGLITATASASISISPTVTSGWVTDGKSGTINFAGTSSLQLSTQAASTITPIESEQTAVVSGKYTTGIVKVAAVSSDYVGSAVTRRGAADLTAAGSVITVPSGWYGTTANKAVASGSITIPSHSFDIKPDITLNSATGKIDLWKSLGYTIPVSLTSGYITQASGPRVAATVDSSYQLPVKAAATIVPSTADQVVASGYFLTGAQTVKGDSALIPSNIAAGVSIFGVQGTYQDAPPNIQSLTVTPSNETQVFNAGVEKGDQIFYKYFRSQSTQNISTPLTNGKKYYVIIKTSTNDGSSFTEKYNNVFTCTTQLEPVSSTLTYVLISTTQVQLTSDYYDAVIVEILDANIIDGYSPVTVEAVAATTSYYLAQDSQGYITYSSIMPSGGEYYIFDVAAIKHIEGN